MDGREGDDCLRTADAKGLRRPRASRRRVPRVRPPPLINSAPTGKQSEDCLVINVWTPGTDNVRRPVIVWLHGGGLSTGSGLSTWHDGVPVAAKQDVVIVTINRRLNAFGYLYLGDLGGGEPTANAQNLADRMSAAWANFARNGDPNGGKTPSWPKYNSASRPSMVWDESPVGPRVENDPRGEQRKRMRPMARSSMASGRRCRPDACLHLLSETPAPAEIFTVLLVQ